LQNEPHLIQKEAIMATKGSLKKKTLIPTWKIMMADCNMEKKSKDCQKYLHLTLVLL
jgi:hypothetical protein